MLAGESERLLAGRYRLLAVIGRGGMGAVWRARDELLNRDVAVKEIVWPAQLDAEERETARRRAVREAQLAARVRHPNVVGVYDIVEEGDRPSIVMELVPFRSLRDAVAEDGPMTPAEAARVGLSVLAALRAVHEAGVVHRDVKPANILLGPDGRVVLADFGIAKAADSPALTISGVLLGSPSYLAPERARGGRAGAAADMWALGASLFAAVEGHPPFERDGVLASLTAVVADELEPSPHAGPLWPVIEGLLLKDPAARLDAAGAEQMLHGIAAPDAPSPTEPDHAQEPDPAPQPDPAPEPDLLPGDTAVARDRAPGRSRRFRAGLAALTAIAAIVAGITMALSRTSGHHAAPRTTPPASAPASQPASAGRASSRARLRRRRRPARPRPCRPVLPVYQFDWFLDRRPARLADLARWSLRVYPGPGQQRHIPADRPVGSAQGQRAGGLAAAGGQPPGHVPRLPPHPAPVGPLSAGRAGRRLGIHLQQEWRHGPGAEPEHPGQRASCLRPLLVDACQRLERLLPLLPGLRGHVPARAGRPARLTAAYATHKLGPTRPRLAAHRAAAIPF